MIAGTNNKISNIEFLHSNFKRLNNTLKSLPAKTCMNHLFPSLRIAISTSFKHHSSPRRNIRFITRLPRYYATMTSGEEPAVPAPAETNGVTSPPPPSEPQILPPPIKKHGKVVLAPMVRTGELPTRLLALKYGADLVWGPETIDKAIIGCERVENEKIGCVDYVKGPRLVYRTCPAKEKSRLVFQVGSASPELAAEAAKVVARDVSGIDLNAGCPKHFSVHAGMGAGLLKNPQNLIAILKSLISAVGPSTPHALPVSVKIRLLDAVEKTHALVTDLCQTGISKLTLHCRTTPMRPRERAIREALYGAAQICKSAGVTFLVNGDVENYDQAQEIIQEYGIEGGAMIAISAEANPSVFVPKSEGGAKSWKEVMTEYLLTAMAVENSFANTKFCILHLVPGKQPEYQLLSRCKTFKELCDIVGVECTIPEERDVGTTKTQKQKAVGEREAQAKREKEERLAKRAETLKRKLGENSEEEDSKNKKAKVESDGDRKGSSQTMAELVAATSSRSVGETVGASL